MHAIHLAGSAYHPPDRPRAGHRHVRDLTPAEAHQPIELTVMLRERPGAPSVAKTLEWLAASGQATRLDDSQLHSTYAPAAGDRARLRAWARSAGVRVSSEDPATRRMTLRAPAGRMAELFGVHLQRFRWEGPHGSVDYRGHLGPVRLPLAIEPVVRGVYGLDDRPIATPRLRSAGTSNPALISYDPDYLATVYEYPALPNGGEGLHLVAGMIELGGVAHTHDVAAAFARLHLPAPEIINVSVDGTLPESDPDGADLEVALDYQVIGAMVLAMAPRARLSIVAYNAANTERGFIDAVAAAATDQRHRPSAVSISWGAPEDMWSLQGMRGVDAAFAAGALRGVTYSAAAGDSGSTDVERDGRQHAEFPASSPHVWACGGTTLLAVGGRIVSESVWNELHAGAGAAGSGVSRVFATPEYQHEAGLHPRNADGGTPGRGLPDGAGVADPVTGWNVLAFGRMRVTGGTSAVAPMYTALWTLVSGLRGRRIGMPHPTLYAQRGRSFHDVVQGDTGGPYAAKRGWDTASGWGSPNGRAIARQLTMPPHSVRVREAAEPTPSPSM